MIAMIAYLQRVGIDLFATETEDEGDADAGNEDTPAAEAETTQPNPTQGGNNQ